MSDRPAADEIESVGNYRLGAVAMVVLQVAFGALLGNDLRVSLIVGLGMAAFWVGWRYDTVYGGALD